MVKWVVGVEEDLQASVAQGVGEGVCVVIVNEEEEETMAAEVPSSAAQVLWLWWEALWVV